MHCNLRNLVSAKWQTVFKLPDNLIVYLKRKTKSSETVLCTFMARMGFIFTISSLWIKCTWPGNIISCHHLCLCLIIMQCSRHAGTSHTVSWIYLIYVLFYFSLQYKHKKTVSLTFEIKLTYFCATTEKYNWHIKCVLCFDMEIGQSNKFLPFHCSFSTFYHLYKWHF